MVLEIKDVDKTYRGPKGEVRALEGVSLSVEAGKLLAVRGPSGCGKTTLLLAAGGLLAPTSGHIILDGRDLYEMRPAERARFRASAIGFVFQQFHLVPYLSVLDNVLTPALARPDAGAPDRARQLIDRFGLSHRRDHVPAALSTGERQRTALARALLNQPRLILADEPTGNLDGESAKVVLGYLTEFTEKGGAVLLVTHDDRAAAYAQATVSLKDGRVCRENGPDRDGKA